MPEFSQLLYETPVPRVARIVMNRPERRNAQGRTMTYELDAAIRHACHDDGVNVIILAGAGPHFSAGHDLDLSDNSMPDVQQSIGLWGQYTGPGWEGHYARERETYFDLTERWRNAPKPTIAEVQGACVAGGLMLAWACDLIVASDDARFRDTTIDMAIPGAEFFHHPIELGARKAKEFLFGGDWLTAQEAANCGMINRIVPRAELPAETIKLAERIAAKDRFALKLAKEAINAAQDAAGRRQALSTAFHLHQIGHLHNLLARDFMIAYESLDPAVRRMIEEHVRRQREGRIEGGPGDSVGK
ncbi:MAG: enoyl-CoA hydratase [Gammaproteobacteria bacterium]|nr:MAG: enoyl-CoA hydratase [Gammaproteobacteria bacterium]